MVTKPRADRAVRFRLSRLVSIAAACLLLAPSAAFGQSGEARAAFSRLSSLPADAEFATAYSAESAGLASLDDAAWLADALASAAESQVRVKTLLVDRAALLELLGRYAEAAGVWESASTAVPGVADAACLLSAAACRLAAGDGEAAAGLATAVTFSSPDPVAAKLAAIVSGWAALSRGDRAAAASTASALAADPEPKVAVPALLLARASTDGAERSGYEKKLASYTSRPESATAIPLLLLVGSATTLAALPAGPEKPASLPEPRAETAPQPAGPGQTFFQVGAFRDEGNAKALVRKLEAVGLKPVVRVRSPVNFFVVYVASGPDASKTVLILKDAGYEAWAVDEIP